MKKKGRLQRKRRKGPRVSYASPYDPPAKRLLINTLELATGRKKIQKYYREIVANGYEKTALWEQAIQKLAVNLHFEEQQLQKLPTQGPLVVIANHPFGIVDGLILGYLISKIRTDFFVMVNEVLTHQNPLADALLPIDFRDNKKAMQTNIQSRKIALEKLQSGQALAIFPAGGVATAPVMWGKAQDLSWKLFVAKAIQQSKATVLPIYFHGQNSRLFQVASRLSLSLRLGLFLHEAKNKIGQDIFIEIGNPVYFETLQKIKNRKALLDYLRAITLSLAIPAHSSDIINDTGITGHSNL